MIGENLRGQVWIKNQIHIQLWPDWESNPGRIGERHGNNRCANPPAQGCQTQSFKTNMVRQFTRRRNTRAGKALFGSMWMDSRLIVMDKRPSLMWGPFRQCLDSEIACFGSLLELRE